MVPYERAGGVCDGACWMSIILEEAYEHDDSLPLLSGTRCRYIVGSATIVSGLAR